MDAATRSFFQQQKERDVANNSCIDCGQAGASWASVKLGCFMCLSCSGQHRGLGVHVSFVRSVTMDTWSEQQKAFMQNGGNSRIKKIFAQYGVDFSDPTMSLQTRYNTKAADYYRKLLKYEVDKQLAPESLSGEAPPTPPASPEEGRQPSVVATPQQQGMTNTRPIMGGFGSDGNSHNNGNNGNNGSNAGNGPSFLSNTSFAGGFSSATFGSAFGGGGGNGQGRKMNENNDIQCSHVRFKNDSSLVGTNEYNDNIELSSYERESSDNSNTTTAPDLFNSFNTQAVSSSLWGAWGAVSAAASTAAEKAAEKTAEIQTRAKEEGWLEKMEETIKTTAIQAKSVTARAVETVAQDDQIWDKTQSKFDELSQKTKNLSASAFEKVDDFSGKKISTFAEENKWNEKTNYLRQSVGATLGDAQSKIGSIFSNGSNDDNGMEFNTNVDGSNNVTTNNTTTGVDSNIPPMNIINTTIGSQGGPVTTTVTSTNTVTMDSSQMAMPVPGSAVSTFNYNAMNSVTMPSNSTVGIGGPGGLPVSIDTNNTTLNINSTNQNLNPVTNVTPASSTMGPSSTVQLNEQLKATPAMSSTIPISTATTVTVGGGGGGASSIGSVVENNNSNAATMPVVNTQVMNTTPAPTNVSLSNGPTNTTTATTQEAPATTVADLFTTTNTTNTLNNTTGGGGGNDLDLFGPPSAEKKKTNTAGTDAWLDDFDNF